MMAFPIWKPTPAFKVWTPLLIGMCFLLANESGQAGVHKSSQLTGTYIRVKHSRDENQSAQIDVIPISRSRIRFHLTALWWPVRRSDSPHNGEIEATVMLRNHVAVYQDGDYRLTLHFRNHAVVLTERGSNPDFGASVSAAGSYRRTSHNVTQAQAH